MNNLILNRMKRSNPNFPIFIYSYDFLNYPHHSHQDKAKILSYVPWSKEDLWLKVFHIYYILHNFSASVDFPMLIKVCTLAGAFSHSLHL